MQTKFAEYITNTLVFVQNIMHMASMYTNALRTSTSSILRTHACIYVSEMKNVLYQVHGAHMFSQV